MRLSTSLTNSYLSLKGVSKPTTSSAHTNKVIIAKENNTTQDNQENIQIR